MPTDASVWGFCPSVRGAISQITIIAVKGQRRNRKSCPRNKLVSDVAESRLISWDAETMKYTRAAKR